MALHYTNQINIRKPRDEVAAMAFDHARATHWMPGLMAIKSISGTPGQTGAVSHLSFRMGKRGMEMTETIVTSTLPEGITVRYVVDGTVNTVVNRFIVVSETEMRWETDNVFELSGVMMKIMGALMPGMFRKQSQKYLESFKAYAETGQRLPAHG